MICPKCQSGDVRHSDTPALHYVRVLTGNSKRYCGTCHHKWRVKPRSKYPNIFVLLLLSGLVTVAVAEITEWLSAKARESPQASPFMNSQWIEKAKKKLKENPGAFTNMSETEKSRLMEKAKKYVDSDTLRQLKNQY